MKLPNGHKADLGSKLGEYCLNPEHPDGKHKARVFASVLGITRDNQDILAEAIRSACRDLEEAEPAGEDSFGKRFRLIFPLSTGRGNAQVFTAWMIRHGEDFPRLITCFIL